MFDQFLNLIFSKTKRRKFGKIFILHLGLTVHERWKGHFNSFLCTRNSSVDIVPTPVFLLLCKIRANLFKTVSCLMRAIFDKYSDSIRSIIEASTGKIFILHLLFIFSCRIVVLPTVPWLPWWDSLYIFTKDKSATSLCASNSSVDSVPTVVFLLCEIHSNLFETATAFNSNYLTDLFYEFSKPILSKIIATCEKQKERKMYSMFLT